MLSLGPTGRFGLRWIREAPRRSLPLEKGEIHMALSQFTKELVGAILGPYCERRIPPEVRDEVKLGFKFRGNSVTLFEQRHPYHSPTKWVEIVVAQFRYDQSTGLWSLYCADRNSRWHEYYEFEPCANFEELVQEVDEDPTYIFWG
jgi:hypothetical protein